MSVFLFNDTATTEIYTLSLHDALPILGLPGGLPGRSSSRTACPATPRRPAPTRAPGPSWPGRGSGGGDRKSTRLNSSHANISYAVFCLKKKNLFHQRLLHCNHDSQ